MDRIVDISEEGRHLRAERGFLVVSSGGSVVGQLPLDDIASILVHAHGTTYSNSLLVALAERGALLVACSPNHLPMAVSCPLIGHHAQTAIMRAQAAATRPREKRLWQQLVVAKIRGQKEVLDAIGASGEGFQLLIRKVGSGDPENIEAQAARRYWPRLFGPDFRRDRDADGLNALLNYGYTVMRAACARAIVGAGLNPSLGVNHHDRRNGFALADDLVEPFRPLVDAAVFNLAADGIHSVNADAKRRLAGMLTFDLPGENGTTPVSRSIEVLALSLARSFLDESPKLALPRSCFPGSLASAGKPTE